MTPKRRDTRALEIVLLAAACCAAQAAVELNIALSYPLRSAVKVLLFLVPAFGWCKVRGVSIRPIFTFRDPKDALKSLALGAGVYGIILGAWFVLRGFIDPAVIVAALSGNLQIGAGNFLWVALYISLGNSLVEEIFFRGFAFLLLRKAGAGWAGLFSALVFAVYHVAMLRGWFSPLLFLLAMAGLFTGGLIFNRLDVKSETIYPGWLAHLFANLAINTVGCMVLGIF